MKVSDLFLRKIVFNLPLSIMLKKLSDLSKEGKDIPIIRTYLISFFVICVNCNYNLKAQTNNSGLIKTDNFDRKNVYLGTFSYKDYRITLNEKKLMSYNSRTISKETVSGNQFYRIKTINFPFKDTSDITIAETLIEIQNLDIYTVKLTSKKASAFLQHFNEHMTGWPQLPGEEKKEFDIIHHGTVYMDDANTPWIPGLLNFNHKDSVILPYFSIFKNTVKLKTYTLVSVDTINFLNKKFICRKLNCGPQGPPGYISYQWYDLNSGFLIRSELKNENSEISFISELEWNSELWDEKK